MNHQKIVIIGAGSVGATTAYALIMKNIPADIVIIDTNAARCEGEVLDLADALTFSLSHSIRTGQYDDAQTADIIIITAGARQHPGQTRLELLATNKKIISSILESISPFKKDAILIMVTNPVDILVRYAQKLSGLPLNQVIGSGTLLDTSRLKELIAQKINVSYQSLHVDIVGEHGDSQFAAWSSAHVDGIPLLDFPGITQAFLDSCAQKVKGQAHSIIERKGATFYGVASCVTALCETIIFDQKNIFPVSCYIPELDVCMSMPVVLAKAGIEQVLMPSFNVVEQKALEFSAHTLRQLYKNDE